MRAAIEASQAQRDADDEAVNEAVAQLRQTWIELDSRLRANAAPTRSRECSPSGVGG